MRARRGDDTGSAWKVPPPRVTRGARIPAPSIQAHQTLAQYTLGMIVIAAIYRLDQPGMTRGMEMWMWGTAGALTVAAACVLGLRIYIQDWLSTLSGPERLMLILLFIGSFLAPGPPRDHAVIPEGFATVMPAVLFFSAGGAMARRQVFVALLGFWFGVSERGGIGLEWALGFGAALLWTLAAMHIALTGAPFGLRGWWPILRVWQTVIVTMIPAGLAAVLFYHVWPEPPAVVAGPARSPVDARIVMQRLADLDQTQWRDLIIRAGVSCAVITAALVALYYLRKYFTRRIRPQVLPMVLGADIGEIEYSAAGRAETEPSLAGNRGRILTLWRQWERAVNPAADARGEGSREPGAAGPAADHGRLPHETAREFAARVGRESASPEPPPPSIARILESAHYSPAEPGDEEVRAMESLVRADLESRGRK